LSNIISVNLFCFGRWRWARRAEFDRSIMLNLLPWDLLILLKVCLIYCFCLRSCFLYKITCLLFWISLYLIFNVNSMVLKELQYFAPSMNWKEKLRSKYFLAILQKFLFLFQYDYENFILIMKNPLLLSFNYHFFLDFYKELIMLNFKFKNPFFIFMLYHLLFKVYQYFICFT